MLQLVKLRVAWVESFVDALVPEVYLLSEITSLISVSPDFTKAL